MTNPQYLPPVAYFHKDPDIVSLVDKRRETTVGRKAYAFLQTNLATITSVQDFRYAYDNLAALAAVLSEAKKRRDTYIRTALQVLDKQWMLSRPARKSETVDRLVKAFKDDLKPERLEALEAFLRETLNGE